jgi:hypothetical protein
MSGAATKLLALLIERAQKALGYAAETLRQRDERRRLRPPAEGVSRQSPHMQDQWMKAIPGDRLVKFTYVELELPEGEAFLTAQIAAHEVVYSVILRQAERPFSREGVERRFEYELRPISN